MRTPAFIRKKPGSTSGANSSSDKEKGLLAVPKSNGGNLTLSPRRARPQGHKKDFSSTRTTPLPPQGQRSKSRYVTKIGGAFI